MQFHIWLQCASGSGPTQENPRAFSWGIHRDGYGPIVDRLMRVLKPAQRVMLHNPFGKPTAVGAKMEFDQQLNCENAGLSHVIKSFEKSVTELVKVSPDVIAYIGAPHNTPRMTNLIGQGHKGIDNWLWNLWRSLRLPMDLGCSIGLDNFAGSAVTVYESRLAHFIDSLCRLYGRRLYIEATTTFDALLYDQFPMFVVDENFVNRHQTPQHTAAKNKFPVFESEAWYKNHVYPLLQTSEFGSGAAGQLKLRNRVTELNEVYEIAPFVTLPLAERLEELA